MKEGGIRNLTYMKKPVTDDQLFTIGIRANKAPRIIATSSTVLVEEWLCAQPSMKVPEEPRWITIESNID